MRGVVEDADAHNAADEACEIWARASGAWEMLKWVLSRDPTKGDPLTEGGTASPDHARRPSPRGVA